MRRAGLAGGDDIDDLQFKWRLGDRDDVPVCLRRRKLCRCMRPQFRAVRADVQREWPVEWCGLP